MKHELGVLCVRCKVPLTYRVTCQIEDCTLGHTFTVGLCGGDRCLKYPTRPGSR